MKRPTPNQREAPFLVMPMPGTNGRASSRMASSMAGPIRRRTVSNLTKVPARKANKAGGKNMKAWRKAK